jgi:hypothetical protein
MADTKEQAQTKEPPEPAYLLQMVYLWICWHCKSHWPDSQRRNTALALKRRTLDICTTVTWTNVRYI